MQILFLSVQLTMIQHCFLWWLGTEEPLPYPMMTLFTDTYVYNSLLCVCILLIGLFDKRLINCTVQINHGLAGFHSVTGILFVGLLGSFYKMN